MKNSNIDWWDIVSKICLEIGGTLLLNGLLMQIFERSKLISALLFKVSKTKVIVPVLMLVISSVSVSLIMKLVEIIFNRNK